jgi:hypothetical protein
MAPTCARRAPLTDSISFDRVEDPGWAVPGILALATNGRIAAA